jgi:hypothetical protein
VKSSVNVLANVGNYGPFGGHVEPADSHLSGAVLTCTAAHPDPAVPGGLLNGPSVDQVLAQAIAAPGKLDSLQVGLSTLDSYTDGLPGPFSRSISWRSANDPLYKIVSPQAAFDRIVGPGPIATDDAAGAARRAADKSILDLVLGHATTVRGQLGQTDRMRMDQFLDSVRTLEQNVAAAAPGCSVLPRPTQTFSVGNVPPDYDRNAHAELMIDLVVMALQCDVTRVVSFMLDDGRSDFVYNFLQMRKFTDTTSTLTTGVCSGLEGLTHAGSSNDGWSTINRWFIEKTASLATKLQAIPDGAGTLLDSATIWCGSEMHGSNRDGLDLPILTIGSGGGRLRTNQSIDFAQTARQEERLANLYLTFLQKVFDLPIQTFGSGAPAVMNPTPANRFGNGTSIIPEILA